MKRTIIAILPLLAPFAGCGDNTTTDMGGTPDMTMQQMPDMATTPDMVMTGPPAAPTLGAQIDRMGRPAINTALVDPFDTVPNMTIDMVKQAYNEAADPTMWDAMFHGQANMSTHTYVAGNLAVFDGLDAMCGNQVAFGAAGPNMPYDFLATVLANDQLVVDTSQKDCNLYLGVEAKALGLPVNDCGGRTPLEDVVDESYTLLAVGQNGLCQAGTMGCPNGFAVTDGVDKDADGMPMNAGFPFLGNPN